MEKTPRTPVLTAAARMNLQADIDRWNRFKTAIRRMSRNKCITRAEDRAIEAMMQDAQIRKSDEDLILIGDMVEQTIFERTSK